MPYIFKRGTNVHEYGDEKYDVDTPYETLVWEEVAQYQGNKLQHRVWRYNKETCPCISCDTSNNMVYLIEPKGVIGRCVGCGCTFPVGPIELDPSGNSVTVARADLIYSKVVTTIEAAKICERIGQVMPTVSSPDRQTYNKSKKPVPKTLAELAKSTQDLAK